MRRSSIVLITAGALVVAAVVAVLRQTPMHDPFDVRDTGPDGLAALTAVLESVGVDVRQQVEAPDAQVTRVLVAVDRLRRDTRADLLAWVEAGGTLVVADPASPLHGLRPAAGGAVEFGLRQLVPACDVPAFAEVDGIALAWPVGLSQDRAFLPDDATVDAQCFPLGEGVAWLTVLGRGAGHVVAIGSMDPLVNRRIGDLDHIVLGAALLGPTPGDRLVVMMPPPPGEGDASVLELVPGRVWNALALLGVALLLAILWRARRLGPPVPERLPPVLPSAELARSVGDLLQRAHGREAAAARLRQTARLAVTAAFGVPRTTAPSALVDLASSRLEISRARLGLALLDEPVGDDDALVAVAQATAELRARLRAPADARTEDPEPINLEPTS